MRSGCRIKTTTITTTNTAPTAPAAYTTHLNVSVSAAIAASASGVSSMLFPFRSRVGRLHGEATDQVAPSCYLDAAPFWLVLHALFFECVVDGRVEVRDLLAAVGVQRHPVHL